MDKNKKKIKRGIGAAILIALIIICSSNNYIRHHTFTLTGESTVKDGQIQPIIGKVKVSGNVDTDVVFTDTESGTVWKGLENLQCVQLMSVLNNQWNVS